MFHIDLFTEEDNFNILCARVYSSIQNKSGHHISASCFNNVPELFKIPKKYRKHILQTISSSIELCMKDVINRMEKENEI
jgi:hypothetical protein